MLQHNIGDVGGGAKSTVCFERHRMDATPPTTVASAEAVLRTPDGQANTASALADIRYWHRQRVFMMDQRKRTDLALGAFLRTQLGWKKDLPKPMAAAIRERAAELIDIGERVAKNDTKKPEKRKPVDGVDDPTFIQFQNLIAASMAGRRTFSEAEDATTKEMERLARDLPVWEQFGAEIKGFGARSLATIIAETGDLSLYANHSKVWKRMGMAVMGGIRQGGLKKGASAAEWIEHGYSPLRRAQMFVIGDTMIKQQNRYRDIYLARKEYERARAVAVGLTVVPAAKIPKGREHEFMSDGHVHRRAQRYMEKRLLKDLWRAWGRAIPSLQGP